MVIDGYPVVTEYVGPNCEAETPSIVSAEWYSEHVKESQYFLQIVKCADRQCCGEWRSNIKDVLSVSDGFLPPPFPLRRTDEGKLFIPDLDDIKEDDSFPDLFLRQSIGIKPVTAMGINIPYDYYCPSVRYEIEEPVVEWIEENDVEVGVHDVPEIQSNENVFPVITNLHDWLKLPFDSEDL
ncbi:uncharacterized protein LOC127279958 [Leptopilina boulardi]|uniref:uncharacterized protein LOC127279958 n=1 Tax=Leptopilina boulardi TaxID=63433 RepID=UPI0021F63300|nr:uncharacterized protein LOC127279958 [Leptopilina boulardi]